ncbi:hypothetical protein [Pontibacter liquoris]|uniref:hypothetical protein n=1 Tax=Pontibacter liquoris TaxID=2905677 RepID=UPI001FA6CFA4|nr:hypothetical protein [Pontibacter liquoris]
MAKALKWMLLLPLCMACLAAYGQDIIVKKDGAQLVAKITRVQPDSIYYHYISDESGPDLAVARQEVAQVQFTGHAPPLLLTDVMYTNERSNLAEAGQMRLQARQDALAYYKPRGVFWTTLGATVFNPVAGLVTGAVVSVVPPVVAAAGNPDNALLKDPIYREAYRKQARKRKIGHAAAGFSAGAAVLSAVYLALALSLAGG